MIKVGDLVKFTNRSHASYQKYADLVGVVLEVDYVAKHNRSISQEYLGAKVIVQFGLEVPESFTEYSLSVI